MKYGQEFRFGYDGDPKARMKMIADAGFDGIMTWWGYRFSKRDGTKESVAQNAKDCGLELFAFHSSFQDVSDIWGTDDKAKKILNRHIANLEDCNKWGCKNLVVHVCGVDKKPTNLEAGLENYAKLFARGEELGINVAMENVAHTGLNQFLIDNLHSPAHKCCYDSGHDNYMSDEGQDVLATMKGRIAVTHLHDNYKTQRHDSHFMMGNGDVDFKRVSSALKSENLEAICLESRNSPQSIHANLSPQDFLVKSLEMAKKWFD